MSSNAERFLAGYLDAWETNEVDSIQALAPDATYWGSHRDLSCRRRGRDRGALARRAGRTGHVVV